MAVQCSLTGGQIRNAALHATLLAVNEGAGAVSRWHLEQAIQSEYRKAGAISPLKGENGGNPAGHGGVEAFLDSLTYRF